MLVTLITRRQKDGEGMMEFLTALKVLAKSGGFQQVTAAVHKEEYIREAFVSGLRNMDTKRKILESSKTKLDDIVALAQVYEDARENAKEFSAASSRMVACNLNSEEKDDSPSTVTTSAAVKQSQIFSNRSNTPCGWCCYKPSHTRERCPARDAQCNKCGFRGHFGKVCKNPQRS